MRRSRKPLTFTRHAEDVISERGLKREWVEEAAQNPDWIAVDEGQPNATRRFRSIAEFGGRILRVVCFESASDIRILTAFFDRGAKRPE